MVGATAILIACLFVVGMTPNARASSQNPSPGDLHFPAPQSGFGGYNWLGKVKRIGAQWKVPAIYKNSRAGDAATWIGAQNDNGNDFIQLGTLENLDLTGSLEYQAFWSDSAVNFVPQVLGEIKAGDTVVVQMTRKGFGWDLQLQDRASALKVNRQIDYGFEDKFNLGEWIQENPSSSYNGLPVLPYPGMNNITFQDLSVNGAAPRLGLDDALVLITSNTRYRVPTPVHNDEFSLELPSAVQLQFLNAMRPSDLEAIVFANEFSRWAKTPTSQRAASVSTFTAALRLTTKTIAHDIWPSSSHTAVQRYLGACDTELKLLKTWSDTSSPLKGSTFEKWSASELAREYLADGVRQSLGLPPTY